jgi:hypothetical protein
MRRGLFAVAAIALSAAIAVYTGWAKAEELPTEIGACSETTIEDIGYRLGGPDSGSAISYAPRGLPARRRSRQGL